MLYINSFLFLVFLFFNGGFIEKKDVNGNPIELGKVNWMRNYDEAVNKAKKENKPIFILFQEVPGCATCQNYGQNVLSNNLIVEAIENEFIPLAIYNNVKGHDRKILNQFNEPTWNNPVIRIITPEGNDIVKRHSGNYSSEGLIYYMQLALTAGHFGNPEYLKLLGEEMDSNKNIEEATYSMYCFWSGEAALGEIDGVIKTTPGFMNGREVVRVTYDSDKLNKRELDKTAFKASCKEEKKLSHFKVDKDPQYYLKKSAYNYLPLLSIQKTKINSALKKGEDPLVFLSPSQINYLNAISKNKAKTKKNLYNVTFDEGWRYMQSVL